MSDVPRIAEARRTERPSWGVLQDGYTARHGAPTSIMVRLEGEKRWRRLMVWCVSNSGTLFLRIRGKEIIVDESDLPPIVDGRY